MSYKKTCNNKHLCPPTAVILFGFLQFSTSVACLLLSKYQIVDTSPDLFTTYIQRPRPHKNHYNRPDDDMTVDYYSTRCESSDVVWEVAGMWFIEYKTHNAPKKPCDGISLFYFSSIERDKVRRWCAEQRQEWKCKCDRLLVKWSIFLLGEEEAEEKVSHNKRTESLREYFVNRFPPARVYRFVVSSSLNGTKKKKANKHMRLLVEARRAKAFQRCKSTQKSLLANCKNGAKGVSRAKFFE